MLHLKTHLIKNQEASPVHERIIRLFNMYTIVGGMPAAVMQYAENRDILSVEKALLLELVYPTSETHLPVLPDFRKKPKLIWMDTGLVNYVAGIQTVELILKFLYVPFE